MAPPAKRRKVVPVEEIEFDFAAREEYLTGFHKRKLQRAKHAQEEAVKKERAQKIEVRKQLRDQRKQELENHVATVNAMLKKAQQGSSDEEEPETAETEAGDDIAQLQDEQAEEEQEYVDEDKYTTVTIEPMKLSSDDDGDEADGEDGEQEPDDNATVKSKTATARTKTVDKDGKQKRVWTKERPDSGKAKKKKKKFRYESKVERKANRMHQKAKNNAAKARREGGDK